MIRPYLHQAFCLGIVLFILCYALSCSRSDDHHAAEPQLNHKVHFKVSGFEAQITPLAGMLPGRHRPGAFWRTQAPYLYLWTFNDTSLRPDIALNAAAAIFYNQGQTPTDFATGFAKDSFPAGYALSIRGLDSIVFQLPLQSAQGERKVTQVAAFGFDMSSSNTGPKDFIIQYSNDYGHTYHTLSASNPFTNMSSQARNSFEFRLDTLSWDGGRPLYIKIIPQAGDRSQVSDYNPATGVTHFDNVYLLGTTDTTASFPVQELDYFIFKRSDSSLLMRGSIDLTQHAPDFQIELPTGKYLMHLVANFSEKSLIIDDTAGASRHFVANASDNYLAEIYGYADTFSVYSDQEIHATLKRYYSQIQFQFTDPQGLDQIKRILVYPLFPTPYYAPFNPYLPEPSYLHTDTVLVRNFNPTTGSFFFNQFLGNRYQTVKYDVVLYGDGYKFLKAFQVEANIPNNVKLTFKGRAFGYGVNFGISLDEQWQGEQESDF